MIWVLVVALILGAGLALAFRQRARPGRVTPCPAANDPAMRDCPQCGNSIAVDWAFCPFCARALSADETPALNGKTSSAVNAGRF